MSLLLKLFEALEGRVVQEIKNSKEWDSADVEYGDSHYVDERVEDQVIRDVLDNMFRKEQQ